MPNSNQERSFDVKSFLKTLTEKPGVYRMINSSGEILYVGKARNLKRRVGSYFRKSGQSTKTSVMMEQVHHVEVTVTHTEAEALILESNLIKEHHPRYNVLLRDDKSYPYIYLSSEDDFPRLAFHRGSRRAPGRYFGPYPNASSVRESLSLLQKVFPVRQCEDSFFRNRSRPCLQYQIKRCTAPCVGLIDKESYREDVRLAVLFLDGKNSQIIKELADRMEQASQAMNYELAAHYRDQIASLKRIQDKQYITGERGNLDVIACYSEAGTACIQVFYIRAGRNLGNKSFFVQVPDEMDIAGVLDAFISQYYLDKEPPDEILLSHPLEQVGMLESALQTHGGRKCAIRHNVRGERKRSVEMARRNAEHALKLRLASKMGIQKRMEALQDALALEQLPTRIECFDISHTMGEATVASCVVFDLEGPVKSDYRRFNIEGIVPGDDYGAMRQALTRRYTRLKRGEGKIPDLLIIDGGKGQIQQAHEVLDELQIEGVILLGIAKGPDRKPGMETLFLFGQSRPFILAGDSSALHLVQQIRDEAHRFAITGHRQRRAKKRTASVLESVAGLGPKRRQNLLKQLGGMREIEKAGIEDLMRVEGISQSLAQKIYDAFHTDRD